jgi:tetratricopeptide (TPR) repeat protein
VRTSEALRLKNLSRIFLAALVISLALVLVSGCSPPDWVIQGDRMLAKSKYKAAVLAYNQAIKNNANNSLALIGKGDALFYLKAYREALASYLEADWNVVVKHKEMLETLDRAIAEDPANSDLYRIKGDVLRVKGPQRLAIEYYDKALALNPLNQDAWIGRYNSLIAGGLYKEAEEQRMKGMNADSATPVR